MGIEKNSDVMRCSWLRWMRHVLRKEGNDWVKKCMEMTVEGSRGRGRPKMTWEKVVERDMKVRGLVRNDAKDGVKWRALSWGAKANSHKSGKNDLKMFVVLLLLSLLDGELEMAYKTMKEVNRKLQSELEAVIKEKEDNERDTALEIDHLKRENDRQQRFIRQVCHSLSLHCVMSTVKAIETAHFFS